MSHDPADLWRFLPIGYLLTVALEAPVLWLGLSRGHSWRRKLLAAWWLTACTYPIVILVLPLLVEPFAGRMAHVVTAEVFAPAAECALFWAAFSRTTQPRPPDTQLWRDMAAIVLANLVSFVVGGWLVQNW